MFESALQSYLHTTGKHLTDVDPSFVAYLANLDCVAKVSPLAVASVIGEFRSQRNTIKLIASENYSSPAVQSAMANLLTDKYAEGVPGSRFYSGCDSVDLIEQHACDLAKELFGVDHAYVAAAQRGGRQPGGLLGDLEQASGDARAGGVWRGRFRRAFARAMEPAAAAPRQSGARWHGTQRRRPPHTRLSQKRIRAHVRCSILWRGPGDRSRQLRRNQPDCQGVSAAHPARRL